MTNDAIKEKFNSIDKTIEAHEKKINNLEKTYSIMKNMEYRMDKIDESIASINEKLDNQAENKGKKWDKLIDYLFYFVIAAILSYVAMKIGIK